MNKCYGCGAILQSEDQNKIGFVPSNFEKRNSLCERCFRMQHYNDLKLVDVPKKEEILKEINSTKNTFAFFMVDFLNIQKEVVDTYKSIQLPKCFVVSKIDYLPKSVKFEKIKNWLKDWYGIEEEILFLSAKKNYNIGSLTKILEENNKAIGYLLGYTNSGKSSLINVLQTKYKITTSISPNTTVDYIKIYLEDGKTLIDTPGFQMQHSVFLLDDFSFIKKINPKLILKPITYPLKRGASVLIEDKIRIENKEEKCTLTFYMSNSLSFKKIYEKNESLMQFNKTDYHLEKGEDLIFPGIGFITSQSEGVIRIYMENKNLLEVRKSLFIKR